MRIVLDPGKEKRSINFIDNIPFSHVKDMNGNEIVLYMSLCVQNGNSEMRLASGIDDGKHWKTAGYCVDQRSRVPRMR